MKPFSTCTTIFPKRDPFHYNGAHSHQRTHAWLLLPELASASTRSSPALSAGHPSIALWGAAREPAWLESTGPLVSPVISAPMWDARDVRVDDGDQILLYTDGVSEVLAGDDGFAEARFAHAIDATAAGGSLLLDAILADVQHHLAGHPQPDDLTLLTARVLAPTAGSTFV